jgi:protein-S-isoprenylcysteine O-methyltransferase Ste14
MAAMDRAEVKILPPIVLAVVLGLQVLFATLLPGRILPGAPAILVGLPFVLASIALVALALREISRARTSFDVRKPTTSIATTGVFGLTRNPVYLSMTPLVLGLGFMLNSPWSLLLAIPTGSALCLTAIRPEERYLEGKFGDAYRAYGSETPRWLSMRRLLGPLRPER